MDEVSAVAFAEYLRKQVVERTAKDYLILVKSCWNWAEETVGQNPWRSVLERVKPAPKQKVKPFTLAEVQAILTAFRTDRYYQHYADFVTFLFGTGCRFGEAVALKWKHISIGCGAGFVGAAARGRWMLAFTYSAGINLIQPQGWLWRSGSSWERQKT